MIKKILQLYYNNKFLKILIFYTFTPLLIVYFLGLMLTYKFMGFFVFDVKYWYYIFSEPNNFKTIFLIFIGYIFLMIAYLLFLHNKYHKLEINCDIKTFGLDEVANNWLRYNKEECVAPSMINNKTIYTPRKNEISKEALEMYNLIHFKDINLNSIYRIILNYAKKITNDEMSLIIKGLKLLDSTNESSIASFYNDDKEKDYLNKQKYFKDEDLEKITNKEEIFKDYNSKEKNYKLLSLVSLKEHTANVIDIMIDMNKKLKIKNNNDFSLNVNPYSIGKYILTALFHDIGKSAKIVKDVLGYEKKLISTSENFTHVDMSISILKALVDKSEKSRIDDVELQEIADAISLHHYSQLPESELAKNLYLSDKEARKIESVNLIKRLTAPKQKTKNEELKLENKRLYDKAYKDALTRAWNRNKLEEFKQELKDISNLIVAFVDGDKFKSVNDTYGHDVGDIAIKSIVNNIFNFIRDNKNIEVYRFGGEEFLIVSSDTEENTLTILERIRHYAETTKYYTFEDKDKNIKKDLYITLSIGVAFGKNHKNFDELVKAADNMVYKAKENGRNRVEIETKEDFKNDKENKNNNDTEENTANDTNNNDLDNETKRYTIEGLDEDLFADENNFFKEDKKNEDEKTIKEEEIKAENSLITTIDNMEENLLDEIIDKIKKRIHFVNDTDKITDEDILIFYYLGYLYIKPSILNDIAKHLNISNSKLFGLLRKRKIINNDVKVELLINNKNYLSKRVELNLKSLNLNKIELAKEFEEKIASKIDIKILKILS